MRLIYRIGYTAFNIFGKLLFNFKVYGRENLIEDGPAIIASNHQSFLDPPLVGMAHSKDIYYLARDTLFKNKIMGWILREVNSVPVDRNRGDVGAIKTILRTVKEGKRVIIFPEGTRSVDGNLQPARAGLGLVIAKTLAPVVPVRVFGSYEVLPKSGKFRFARLTVVIGKPIHFSVEEIRGEDRSIYQKLSERVMAEIAKLERPSGR
jgi:1-acyl-sn-glycerol-3-phosphate acyltransferase